MNENFNLVKWDAIRTQIEMAKDIDELVKLKDKLRAYQILAEQSKQAIEVQAQISIYKARADRKCGEWLRDNVQQGGDRKSEKSKLQVATLNNLGIEKTESHRLQKIAAIPENKFEEILQEAEEETKRVTSNMLVNIAKEAEKKDKRNDEELKPMVIPDGIFNVIYADPPWQYSNSGFEMSAENKYPTMPTEDICNMQIPKTTENAVLFLWVTNPLLNDGLQVMKRWGFEYKTNFVWTKERHTAGFYVFGMHELLLIGIKGSMLPTGEKYKSIIEGNNSIHSKKPEIVYSIIEKMYPNMKYIEMFARNKKEGWESWGNQCEKY